MFFKNLRIYKLRMTTDAVALNDTLLSALAEHPARECAGLELFTVGWQPPLGRGAELLTHAVNGRIMISARRDEKILPTAVVNDHVDRRVEDIEATESRLVRRKERTEIKEEVLFELIPRAFSKASVTYAYIDLAQQILVVDTSSSARAEELLSLLRQSLGSLQVRPISVAQSPSSTMTDWLRSAPPPCFSIQYDAELHDLSDEGSIVKCKNQDLTGEEVATHLEHGKMATKMEVDWRDRATFTLDDELSIRRFRFTDMIMEEACDIDAEDAATRFDADFSIMGREIASLIDDLAEAFGGIEELAH